MPNPRRSQLIGVRGGGASSDNLLRYDQKIKNLFGSSIIGYWPLWDASGVNIEDISGKGRTGAYRNTAGVLQGVTLGQTGIGNGKTAIALDGTGFANIYSAGFAGDFNGQEGTALVWVWPTNVGVWTDAAFRVILYLFRDASNNVAIYKKTTNNYLQWDYVAGGVTKSGGWVTTARTSPFQVGITWSLSNNRLGCFYQGQQFGGYVAGVGTWAGALSSTRTLIGASNVTPAGGWNGFEQEALILNREATPAEIWSAFKLWRPSTYISYIGDSITTSTTLRTYAENVADNYNDHCVMINHAVGGQSIMLHMDAQVAAAANDNADIIIMALGTNDNDAGDMVALQAKVESNIVALKASNPRARIFYSNVLKRWSNNTVGAEVDKSHIRAAIAAACTAQGITCWDTYTVPWVAQNQTSDGLHPAQVGHDAYATQVLAQL